MMPPESSAQAVAERGKGMRRSGLALFLVNTVGDVGAVIAAIKFWDENRTLSYIAIAAAVAVVFLPPALAFLGVVVGVGLFAYALSEDRALSVATAVIAGGLMFALSAYLTRQRRRQEAEHEVARVEQALTEVMEVSRESRRLDPATPPQHAVPTGIESAAPTPEQPTQLPLPSYAPILHRALVLSGEAMGGASGDKLRELQIAAGRMMNFRPEEPALAPLHRAAADYAYVMFKYCDMENEATNALFTSRDKDRVRELRGQEARLKEDAEAYREVLQEEIRFLYHEEPGLFDRLDFSDRQLTWLYLDDIVDDRSGYRDTAPRSEPGIRG